MTLEGRRRRRWGAVITAATIGAVIATTAGGPALAAANDRAESEGRLLTGAGVINLNTVAELGGAYSADPTAPGEVANPLSLEVLQALNLDLGDGIQLLRSDGSGILAVGAAGQYATTPADGIPFASAGAINADGSIAFAPDDPAQNAYVDLTELLGQAGVGDVISQLRLELGAVSASATLDENGEPVGDYQLADGNLVLTSPAVAGLSGNLSTALDAVETPINNLAGEDGAIDTALDPTLSTIRSTVNGLLLGLGSVDELGVTATADVDLDAAVASVLEAPLSDEDNIVEIDLSTGEVEIDLARAIANSNGGDYDGSLNNLPPNTELLDADLLNAVVDGAVTSALEDLPDLLVTAVSHALNTTEVTIDIDLTIVGLPPLNLPIGDINISLDGALGGFVGLDGYDTPAPVIEADVVGLPVGDLLQPVAELVTSTILPALVSPLQDAVTNQEALTGIITPVVGTVTTALDPILGLVSENVLSATANVQEQDGDFVDERGEDADSFTQRAIKLSILPGGDSSLIDVSLASATVRGELADDDDSNANASSSAAASADADDDSNASAEAAAQAAANADATSEASADADASAEAAAAAAATADVDAGASTDASADVDAEGNANAAAAAAAQSTADADSTANAAASADQSADDNADATSSAAAASQAAAEADSSADASQEASADADAAADPEGNQDADPDGNQDADPDADQNADQDSDVNA
ncbi:MAG: choice-of-anchor G family protein, partial [Propionibacteriaceae bacterium]